MVADALERVFLTHRAELARFVRARCGNAADTEDFLQDLWLKLSGVPAPPSDPLSYLYQMANNLIIDRRRSEQRRERRDDAWADGGAADSETSDAPSAERLVIARSELARVAAMFDELGERTTAIFKSYRLDGAGQRDIATEHGISLSAVEKHLQKAYRAVLQLRYKLDAENGESDRLSQERAE